MRSLVVSTLFVATALCANLALADERLTVSAAASLTDVLPRVASAWKAEGGTDVVFQFDASSRLAQQIDEGAPVDVFLSADAEWMDFLEKKHRLEAGTRTSLLGNSLVVVVPTASPITPTAPKDLADLRYARLALAGENVPAGRYARAALKNAAIWEAVEGRIVNGATVRAALELVARNEVPAAVVYRTDALAERRVRLAFTFDLKLHPRVVYPIAAVKDSTHLAAARRFLAFCRTAKAERIFLDAGFTLAGAD